MLDLIRPFSNGTQFADWTDRNCDRCKKSSEDGSKCDLEMALCTAYITSGTLTQKEADRIGFDERKVLYTWDCTERELKDNA